MQADVAGLFDCSCGGCARDACLELLALHDVIAWLLLVQCLGLNFQPPELAHRACAGCMAQTSARTARGSAWWLCSAGVDGLLAAQVQGLLTSVLQLLTVTVALARLLQLGGVVSLPALLLRSARLLAALLGVGLSLHF